MRCYKCNSVLSDSDYCLKCGADVSVYKVVVKASNTYYNQGLAKAQVRDITGAIPALRTSIKINKNNIKARNLLGLCYFEIGEVAKALSEWVISVNLKPDKNVASAYIRKVKANPNKLEVYNQAAKKFNFSLEKAKQQSEDVAFIQLKKVVSLNPRFVKANLLLALIFIKNGDKDNAVKTLMRVLRVDRNNTLALRYLDELNKTGIYAQSSEDELSEDKSGRKKKALSGHDVIMPKNSYKEPSNGILNVVYILLGVVIGVALLFFLVVPSKLQSAQYENNEKIKDYQAQLSANLVQINQLEENNGDLTQKLNDAKEEIKHLSGNSGVLDSYNNLVAAASLYIDNDFKTAAEFIVKVKKDNLTGDSAKELYDLIDTNCVSGASTYREEGKKAFDSNDFAGAIELLTKSYNFDNENVETLYYLTMSYYYNNDEEGAAPYAAILKSEQYADTTYAAEFRQFLKKLEDTKIAAKKAEEEARKRAEDDLRRKQEEESKKKAESATSKENSTKKPENQPTTNAPE